MKILGSRPHVLVVDDDAAVCQTVAAVLASHGYVVSRASTAQETLTILASAQIKLVILDVEIGDDSGLDLLEQIKSAYRSVYVVMLTGRGYDEETWQAARKRGATGYVSKALPPTHLVMEVDRWLRFC